MSQFSQSTEDLDLTERDLEAARVLEERVPISQMPDSEAITEKDYTQSERLFRYAQAQRSSGILPWCQEYGILHRLNVADINNQLAVCKKRIYQNKAVSKQDMRKIRRLLDEQATALRNFDYIQSLEYLHPKDKAERLAEIKNSFFDIAGDQPTANPYNSETYRRLIKAPEPFPHGDPLRHFFCSHLPVSFTYPKEEKKRRQKQYEYNIKPRGVSQKVERLARFVIAMFGAVSILVPMIIMSLNNSKTKSLVTTSIAVVLFACICSFMLRTANDQTLAATAGYAAVLMVFVGLTAGSPQPVSS